MSIHQPFFMRFVEKQTTEPVQVQTAVKAGAESGIDWKKLMRDKGQETMKYPSDGDDDIRW